MFRKFWMVLGAGVPVYRHQTEREARVEAERLAKEHSQCEFYVLEATWKVQKSSVVWSEATEDTDIPF
jgi:uncharacterized protein YfiM (DUF2279 family)